VGTQDAEQKDDVINELDPLPDEITERELRR